MIGKHVRNIYISCYFNDMRKVNLYETVNHTDPPINNKIMETSITTVIINTLLTIKLNMMIIIIMAVIV